MTEPPSASDENPKNTPEIGHQEDLSSQTDTDTDTAAETDYFDESGQDANDGTKGVTDIGFLALCAVQFLTAINDNMFRWFIVSLGQKALGDKVALALGAVLFIAPYLVFSPVAGFLADRFSKRKIIIACKFAEIVLMAASLVAIQMNQTPALLVMLFLMGTQSALFSPAKMGAIPEILAFKNLSSGNGIFAMVTLIGTALGTFAGYQLYGATFPGGEFGSIMVATVGLVGIAIIGWLISFAVQTQPAANPTRTFSLNPLKELVPSLKLLFSNRWLMRAAVGIALFYSIALLVQVNLDTYGQHVLKWEKQDTGYLAIFLILGIGGGGILSGLWSAGRIQLGMVPVGATGIVISSFVLAWLTQAGEESISDTTVWASMFWLFALGVVAGLFYIPLESYLQHTSELKDRGTILAASNALTNLFMLLSMGLFFLLSDQSMLNWSPSGIFALNGGIALFLAVTSLVLIPLATMRFLMWLWCHTFYRIRLHGVDKLPLDKGLLFTPNHISWLDGVFLVSLLPKHARFLIYADYTEKGILNWLSRKFEVIPIKSNAGPRALINSLKDAENSLNRGDWVCIFPEGQLTRSGKIQPFQKGAMRIVSKSKAPIIPVYLDGLWGSIFSYSGKLLWRMPTQWRRQVDIWFGEPITEVPNASELQQKVITLGAHAMNQGSQKMLIPARQFIRQAKSAKYRSKVADSSEVELTGGKLLASTIAFARVLRRELNLSENDNPVGVLLPPSVGGVLANTALALLNRTSVNLNYTLSDDVMNFCIKEPGVKYVLTSKKFLEKKTFPIEGAEFVCLEDLKEKVTSTDRAIAALQAYLMPASMLERLYGLNTVDPNSILTIIFTSGSTGEPKGVMLSHRNIASNADAVDQLYSITEKDTLIGVLPFFHSFGYTISLWLILMKNPRGVYHFNPLDARKVGELSGKYQGSLILSTPTFLKAYAHRCTPEQFAKMRLIVVGAEKLPLDLAEKCKEKFGVTPIEGYGSTETSPLSCANGIDFKNAEGEVQQVDNKLGTVGQPINGVIVRAVDSETDEPLPIGTEGLLMVKGPNVMVGYLNQPEKTAEVIRDGWYDSGDLGYVDEDGFVVITGRKSRFSKIGGEMVPHIRVEEELMRTYEKHAQPNDDEKVEIPLAVTSVPDKRKGEKLIVLYKSLPCEVDDLINSLGEAGLPNIWIPARDGFIQVEEIPLLGTGKLDLKAVQKKALELVS